MAMKVLGIELGERLIKVCETNMGQGARKVSACAMFPTPPNAVSDGEVKDAEAIAAALKENLHKHGIKNRKVVFTVSSGRIAIREVTVPPVRDSRIKSIIEANASDYFPVDMSKYHMTYTLQERKTSGEDAGCRVLVMAAPIAILEGYFTLANLAGFTIQAIDYGGNSLYRFLETQHNDGVTMYIDVNGTYSVTTVLKKSKLLMQRTFPSGVDDFVLAYMGSAEKSDSDYMPTLLQLSSEYFDLKALGELPESEIGENLSRLVGNISRMADYYNSSNWEAPIERLILTGAGASVVGLKNAVAESTDLPVSILQKLDKVAASASCAAVLPQYISCLGCTISPVDFIPERFSKAKKKESKKKKESVSLGVTVLAAGIIAAAALSYSAYTNYTEALEQKQAVEKQVSDLAYTETVYNNYISYNKYKDNVSVLDTALKSPNDSLRQFIDELEKKMPSEVSVLSINCAKDSVAMNITVETKTAAAKTIQQLRSFESIKVITVGEFTELLDGNGLKTVSFSVLCKYDYTPAILPKPTPSPSPAAQNQGAASSSAATPSPGITPSPSQSATTQQAPAGTSPGQ